jgi:hypothetical protein
MQGKLAFHFVYWIPVATISFYLLSCICIRIMLNESGSQYVQHHRDFMHIISKLFNLKYVYKVIL